MIKYIVFDFDGTLADSKDVFISAWNQLAEMNRFKKIQPEDIDNIRKLTIKERSKVFDFPMYKLPIIMSKFYKLYKESLQDVHLFDGIREMLVELHEKGYKIAIISSNSEDIIRQFLSRREITVVSDVLCSSKIFGKDRLLKRFMREKSISHSEMIYVGDEERDVIACNKVGIPIIWVSWGYDAYEAISAVKPRYKVNTPEEILQIV